MNTASNIDQLVFRMAGSMVLISIALSLWLSVYWLALAAFVGLNMLQASFTGFCPAAKILAALKVPAGAAFDVRR